MNVAIVGGSGKMGKLVSYFLQKNRHRVSSIGKSTRKIKKILERSDVIMFSVPQNSFHETVSALCNLNLRKKLIIDLSSYIGTRLQTLRLLSPRAVFMHFLFGPDIYHLKDQHIVISQEKIGGVMFKKIVDIFKKEGADIIESSAKHHDAMMAYTQALSQFNSIALAKTLAESGLSKKELENFSTITFALNVEAVSRIAQQDADLWAGIQFNNKHFQKILNRHQKNIGQLATTVMARDSKAFREMFRAMSAFWKEKKSDAFIPKERERLRAHQKGGIGLLGPPGTFSQQAALQYNKTLRPVFFDTISDVIDAIDRGNVEKAILPVENSIEGTIRETLDGLYYKNLKIIDEVVLNIQHCIAGINRRTPPRDVKYLYSHPQALAQCRTYIQKHYPRARLILTPSTSAALQKVKEDALVNARAIGPQLAADIYKLAVVDQNIQDKKNNATRFAIIAKNPDVPRKLKSILLVIAPKKDKPGLLYNILSVFAKKNINLSKIESRPSQNKLGEYIFYLRADIKSTDPLLKKIVHKLRSFGSVTMMTH